MQSETMTRALTDLFVSPRAERGSQLLQAQNPTATQQGRQMILHSHPQLQLQPSYHLSQLVLSQMPKGLTQQCGRTG